MEKLKTFTRSFLIDKSRWTTNSEIKAYKAILKKATIKGSRVILGVFSKEGPLKCSGIEIHQYDEREFKEKFEHEFSLLTYENIRHDTPFNTSQQFCFASLKKN